MAGSRAAKFVDENIGGKSPGWMEPSGGRDTEEMHDGRTETSVEAWE